MLQDSALQISQPAWGIKGVTKTLKATLQLDASGVYPLILDHAPKQKLSANSVSGNSKSTSL